MPKVQQCNTLEELASMFQTKLTTITQTVQLRDADSDATCQTMLQALASGLSDLDIFLALMRAEVNQRRKALQTVQELKKASQVLQDHVEYAKNNLPTRLPQQQQDATSDQAKPRNVRPSSVTEPKTGPRESISLDPVSVKPTQKAATKGKTIPTLDYLMVEEFESVPKYMKGRITYDQANSAIDELNKAITAKYKLLHTPKSEQTEKIKKMIRSYKEQETKDTKGLYFIVDNDIKTNSGLRLDSVGRSLLTMFRHCGRIKEIRGKGLTRYVVCV